MDEKICIISLKAYPLFNKASNAVFGGAEVQLFLLAREFAKNENVDVSFIVADYGQKSSEKYGGITVVKSFKIEDPSLVKNIKFLKCFVNINADIYIQRTLDPASGIIAILCKLLRKRFVYMVAHDMEVDGEYENNEGMMKSLLANVVFKYADVIVVQNTTQKDLLYINKGRDSILIKSGYPINDSSKTNKDDYILWVGRSKHWKRPELFIELAKLNTYLKFKMICPQAFNDQKDRYSLLKQDVMRVKNLEFIEYVPFSEIDKYFKKAKIFVNTSVKEGFPNTFIQAAKNGTPIISMNVDPHNFLDETKCGFFCEDKIDEMDRRLNQLLNDVNLYDKMSENAYKYAKENHDIKKNANQFYDFIKDLIYVKK